jgi:hypothetical protein
LFKVCGVSENTRIIGGALADPKEWLWMVCIIELLFEFMVI